MPDPLDYLSPDFDLNTLTVPRLRSILVNHDVTYPASAKKGQLIRILEDEVLPQAKKLLRERERVKRTSEGIVDMGSREGSVASSFDDGDNGDGEEGDDTQGRGYGGRASSASTAVPRMRRGQSAARTTRGSTVDEEERSVPGTPATTTSRRTVPRSEMSSRNRGEENEKTPIARTTATPKPSTARKARRGEMMTPSTEPELPPATTPLQPPVKFEPSTEKVFTDDNPFQSGSPAGWEQQKLQSAKRKSYSRLSEIPGCTDTPRARKSNTPTSIKQEGDASPSTRSPYRFSSPYMETYQQEPPEDEYDEDNDDVTGEEFTPEEQLALEHEQADRYTKAAQPRRPRKQGKASKALSWVVILALLGGFAGWWRKEKVEIGFCGIGKPTWSLAGTNVPEWANSLFEPQCESCPSHAFCYPDFKASCDHDFILTSHPLSLGGLIPLPPTCEPDSEKARRVKAVADKTVEELRDRRAKWECGELSGGSNSPEMSEPELKHEIGNKRRKGMSDAEFNDLWKGALGEVVGKEEVVTKSNQRPGGFTFSSTAISRLPLTCAFRRHLRLSLVAYRLPISILILILTTLIYIRSRIRSRRSDLARVPDLVAATLDRLATQAALHARGGAREPYIPIGQLRDDVLRSELQGRRRKELWARVHSVVEGNANIRASVREGRGGDIARVWEWIGGIGSVSSDRDLAANTRPSSYSTPNHQDGRTEQQSQPHEADRSPHPAGNNGGGGVRAPRWDEGRPIY